MSADLAPAPPPTPADTDADALARALVDERLAACVSVHAPMSSTYRWQDAVTRDAERQVVIKTTAARVAALEARLGALHPYAVPEFLVIPVASGGADYLAWARAQVED